MRTATKTLIAASLFTLLSCRETTFSRSGNRGGKSPVVDPNGQNQGGPNGTGPNGTGPNGTGPNGTGTNNGPGSGPNGTGGTTGINGSFGFDPSLGLSGGGNTNLGLIGSFNFLASIINLGRGNPFAVTFTPPGGRDSWHIGDPQTVNVNGQDVGGYSSSTCLGHLDSRPPDAPLEARFVFRTLQPNTKVSAHLVYCGVDYLNVTAMLIGPSGTPVGQIYAVPPTYQSLFGGEEAEARMYVTPRGFLNIFNSSINLAQVGIYKVRFLSGKQQQGNFLDTDNVWISKVRVIPDKPVVLVGFEGG